MKAHLTELLAQAAKSLAQNSDFDATNLSIHLERPKNKEHGDFSTNLAMLLAKPLRQNPRAIAEALIKALPATSYITKTEIAGAGFINFYLDPSAKQAVVKAIQQKGAQFGRNQDGQGKKVQVEFVSANPDSGSNHSCVLSVKWETQL